jgi:glycosyltransferase involved in cell wall biosynthesis
VPEPLRIAHLTTVDMSLALLLETELVVDLEAGHEVLGISSPGPYVQHVEHLGVRHVPLPALTRSWSVRSDLAAARQLWRAIKHERPDVLHTHNPKTGVLGRVLGRLARVPVVVNTCHGLWAAPEDRWIKRVVVLAVEALAAQFSHAELYQNADDRQALRWVVPERKAAVVGNGVDLERFRYDSDGRARLRAEWGVPEDAVLVGAVGRLVEEKGVAEFANAARRLAASARFVWIGPTDRSRGGRNVEPPDGVQLIPEQRSMPAVYSALDVFVLPSHREGFSRSAMEAASCGRAMVLSDIRGCREIGTHGEHLLLVPAREVDGLTAAIAALVADPGLRTRLGTSARKRAQQTFDQRAVARLSLETYARVRRSSIGMRDRHRSGGT